MKHSRMQQSQLPGRDHMQMLSLQTLCSLCHRQKLKIKELGSSEDHFAAALAVENLQLDALATSTVSRLAFVSVVPLPILGYRYFQDTGVQRLSGVTWRATGAFKCLKGIACAQYVMTPACAAYRGSNVGCRLPTFNL